MRRIGWGERGFQSGRGTRSLLACGLLVVWLGGMGCSDSTTGDTSTSASPAERAETTSQAAATSPDLATSAANPAAAAVAALAEKANMMLKPLPASVPNPENEGTPAKIDLGRMLYYETRLSKNHDLSCNSCHLLDRFGVDNERTSPGHKGARGDRNSPSVYNAAIHIAQFWDGRAADVEAQAKGPILNPIEMAAPSEAEIEKVLASIPGYVEAFAAAFPGEANPATYDNATRAIGAFERNLMTPGRLDAFMGGDLAALSEQERRGLETFVSVGCNSCHTGSALGGQMYRKLGFVFAYETKDPGREKVTADPADRQVFKVPSLRNVAKTGPYFHDGSIATLDEAVRLMGYHQVGIKLEPAQIADIVAFLGALTGEVDAAYIARPALPESGPSTPKPDPS